MAEELPDAPWITGGGSELPDAPWVTGSGTTTPSTLGDVAKSAGIGAVKGGIGIAGMPGDFSRAMDWAGDWAARKMLSPDEYQRQHQRFEQKFQPEKGNPIPGSADIQHGLEKATGPLYEPKTSYGQAAETVGEFAPNVIGGPGSVAGKVATRVLAPAAASETAGYLTKGTQYEPWARAGAALATQLPRAVKDINTAVSKPPINAPELEELKDAAQQAYREARNYGVEIKRAPVARLADDIMSDLHNDGFRKLDAPSAWAKIEELKNPAGQHVTISDIESVRKALGKVNPANGVEKEVGRRATEAIDKYVENLDRNAGHIAVNPHFADAVANTIKEARGNWGAMKRGETIQEAMDAAQQQTGRAGSGANINNALRQQISRVLRSPKLRRGFSNDELDAMRQVVMGTKAGNAARKLGKLSPEGIVSGTLGIELGHLATGNLAHGLILPALGKVAKIFGDRSTAKQVERLSQRVRSRSPLGQTLPQPGRQPVSVSPYVGTGLLGQSSAEEHEGHAAGGRAEGGGADDEGEVSLSPDAQALASSMTHYAEQPNPAQPYLDAVKNRFFGADYNPIVGPNTRPEDYGRELLQNPDILNRSIEQAMPFAGMVGSLKGAGIEKIAGAAFLHEGKIYSGPNHTIALDQARNAGIPGTDVIKNGKEGFVTDSGRFVDRKQAVDIANAAEQWRGPIKPSDDELAYAREKGITREALKPLSGGRPPAPSITAYHGSPHDFDRFDISKIGTGEGAQAYGHGLYFAENEGTALKYRDDLTPHYYYENGRQLGPAEQNAASMLLDHKMSKQEAIDYISGPLRRSAGADQSYLNDTLEALKKLDPSAISKEKRGRMYQVAIKADPEHFLDWDKPLSEQSEHVRKAVAKIPNTNPKVDDLRAAIAKVEQQSSSPTQAERLSNLKTALAQETSGRAIHDLADLASRDKTGGEILRAAGIPGIKYLDQGSRATTGGELLGVSKSPDGWTAKIRVQNRGGAGFASPTTSITTSKPYASEAEARAWADSKINQGTRNFVVFDDKLVDILKKYGLAGLVASGAYHYQDKARAQGRAHGGRIVGAHSQSDVGLAQNEPGTTFRCGTCKYFAKGKCHNENPELKDRKVKPHWCCNLYWHDGMKVIA